MRTRRRSSRELWNLHKVRRKAVRAKRRRRSSLRRVSPPRLILRRGAEMVILKRHHQLNLRLLGRNQRRGQGLRVLRKVGLLPSLGNLLKKRK
jgi:hypothetical protein